MNGTTFKRVMRTPFSIPQRPPASTPTKRAAAIGKGGTANFSVNPPSIAGRPTSTGNPLAKTATRTVTSATAEPIDRSIPPEIITAVIPKEAIPTITAWTEIVRQFNGARNGLDARLAREKNGPRCGVIHAKNATTSTSPKNGPATASTRRITRPGSRVGFRASTIRRLRIVGRESSPAIIADRRGGARTERHGARG